MLKLFVVSFVTIFLLSFVKAQNSCPTEKLVVCYYASWGIYRSGVGNINVTHIDPQLCTHLVYSFAGLDVLENKIVSLDTWNDLLVNGEGKDSYKMFVQLKEQNPCLKTILAIGGWNEMSRKYSVMANTDESRKDFAKSVVRFLTRYEFDGIDFDWEYPTQRGGIAQDKQNFVSLLTEIKNLIKPWDLTLSIAVGVMDDVVTNAYDIKAISNVVDFISLMAYDYTSALSKTTGLLAPLDSDDPKEATIAKAVDAWLAGGAPPEKLILGVPMYARSFKLKNPDNHDIGAETEPNTMKGKYTGEIGFLSYYELADLRKKFKYEVGKADSKYQNQYIYNGTYWITFDDENTLQAKAAYALQKKLGGIMAWSIDTDDFRGAYNQGNKYPLLKAINKGLGKKLPNNSYLNM